MNEDAKKLLGGYATGNLTPEQEQALCEAALQDQQLFDAMAGEQALRDLLSDPGARDQLLAAIERPPVRRRWLIPVSVLAMAAAAAVAVVVFRPAPPSPKALPLVAEVHSPEIRPPAPPPAVASQPAKNALVPQEKKTVGKKRTVPVEPPAPPPLPQAPSANGKLPAAVPPVQSAGTVRAKDTVAALGQPGGGAGANAGAPAVQSAEAAAPKLPPPPPAATVRPVSAQPVSAGFRDSPAGAQAMALAAPAAPPLFKTVPLPFKVAVQRRLPDGSYEDAVATQLRAGDFVKLRITPETDGVLTVTQNVGTRSETLVRSESVEHGKPFELYLPSEKPEVRVLRLQFAARATGALGGDVTLLRTRSEPKPPAENLTLVFR